MVATLDVADPPGSADLPAEVLGLQAALDALARLDPRDLASGETLVVLHRQLSRMEAVVCHQAAAFDRDKAWKATTAQNAPAWIATRTRTTRTHARRRLRLGHALRRMEHVDAAFRTGAIGIDHVDALAAARSRSAATRHAFDRDERLLVEWATSHSFALFREILDEWLRWADEDGADDDAARRHEQRGFDYSQTIDGMWVGTLTLDPINGEILDNALRAVVDELFDRDWRIATAELGRTPTPDELAHLTRTPTQRRADAVAELARRAMTVPAGGRAPKPLFTVVVDHESFIRTCRLGSNTVTSPGALVPWLTDADIERIVFDSPDRVLSVSRRRTFEGALRRAIQVRDQRCSDDFCDLPAERCEIDHVHPWALGGPTSLGNGDPKCEFHNRLRNGPHDRQPRGRPTDPPDA